MKSARLVSLLVVVLCVCARTFSQTLPPTTADDQMGLQPYQSYHGGDIDSVGLSNGTLTLHYPFLAYSQRGNLELSFTMFYNNQPQHLTQFCPSNPPPNTPKCFFFWYFPSTSPLPEATIELGKVTGNSPGDNHHKQEGRAMLERAKRLAERLPPRFRDAILQGIRSIEGRVPGGL